MTTIAEVLHRAADRHLWDGSRSTRGRSIFSCFAIYRAAEGLRCRSEALRVSAGLAAMGMPIGAAFIEFEDDPPSQQAARYAWLKFAALIAEEQGV